MHEEQVDDLVQYVIDSAFEGLSESDPWSVEIAIREWFKNGENAK